MTEITSRLSTAVADRYRIERHLGEGGMATVYLAHDIKHDRKVALKVLRPELAAVIGAERFLNEIKVTANLQHPHILPLHDSGDADSFLYYVMPYIEGDTLRDKLDRERQLAIEDAIEITRSIASALDYAHRQGVIHRDIKPENILIHDGQALVADFGIALAVSHASGQRLTETGLSLGTPHYMSPEQAMGDRELDARSDVYSLGAMLYEMLAGVPPYQGPSAQAVVAKVITEKAPPVTAARDTVPGHVNAAVAKALNKMPADRFATAASFADALTNVGFTLPSTVAMPVAEGRPVARKARFAWPVIAGALAVTAGWALFRSTPVPERPVIRYELSVPELEAGLRTNFGTNIAISPDGRRFVYTGADEDGAQLFLRERNRLESQPVAGGDGAHQPFFSPAGNRVGFITGSRALRIVSLTGEPPVTLVDSGIVRGGGAWGDDGYVYFIAGIAGGQTVLDGVSRMLATGGPIEPVSTIDTAKGEVAHLFPEALPQGRGIVFVVQTEMYNANTSEIAVVDLEINEQRNLLEGSFVRWSPTGHLIVVRGDGSLVAAPFDLAKLEVTGPIMPLLEGVSVEGFGTSDIALSASGTLMYQAGMVDEDPEQVVWVTPDGAALPVDTAWAGDFGPGSLSPDGTRLALEIVENGTHVWIKQLDDGPSTKMTFEGTVNRRPVWTPDGRYILFLSNRGENFDVFRRRADGSAPAELLLDHDRPIAEVLLSPDGEWLVYRLNEGPTGSDIYARRVDDSTEVAIVAGQFDEMAPALSPDGRWLAYVSGESGTLEVYVRPFPTEQARWQISNGLGTEPVWSHSGRQLYFRGPNGLVRVEVTTSPTFAAGEQTVLFPTQGFALEFTHREYAIAPGDDRFLMNRVRNTSDDNRVVVVDNWFKELTERVGSE